MRTRRRRDSRPRQPKLCMFCAKPITDGVTHEHFAFQSLWAGARPNRTRTVPAHADCNASAKEDSDYVRDVLALEAPADSHPEIKRLQEGPLRRKVQKQPGAMRATLGAARLLPQFSPSGLCVGFAPVMDIDVPRMQRALSNVVRGIYYTSTGKPLPADIVIGVCPATQDNVRLFAPAIEHMVPWQSFGDDVFICRYVNTIDPPTIRCAMQFYRRRTFLAEAMPLSLLREHELNQRLMAQTGKVLFTGESAIVI